MTIKKIIANASYASEYLIVESVSHYGNNIMDNFIIKKGTEGQDNPVIMILDKETATSLMIMLQKILL